MALQVEGIVDDRLNTEEALDRACRFKSVHLAISPPYGQMRVFHSSALLLTAKEPLLPRRRKSALPVKNRMRATRRMLFAIVSRRAPCPSTSLTISCSTRSRF
jgi:hypothetical protein